MKQDFGVISLNGTNCDCDCVLNGGEEWMQCLCNGIFMSSSMQKCGLQSQIGFSREKIIIITHHATRAVCRQ